MFETLYKTNVPEELERAEYYHPMLDVQTVGSSCRYFVRETHGWFSDPEKKNFHHVSTLNPTAEEGFDSYEEAKRKYDEQVRHRAKEGFVHAFSLDLPDGRIKYRCVENG